MDKRTDLSGAIASLRDGMTIGVGGWGPRRKPMALIREILRSDLKDLHVVTYGGPEVGMLCAAGKVAKVTYGFVSLDQIPLEPWYRRAREAGTFEVRELDEGMLLLGLRAAAEGVPFAPTRVGLGSAILEINPEIKTVVSPYDAGDVLLAMPALPLDVALIHVSRSDARGNTRTEGNDPYFDDLFAGAAERVIVSTEELVDSLSESDGPDARKSLFHRGVVDMVVHAPLGAHPTLSHGFYGWDMAHLKEYGATAGDAEAWADFVTKYVADGEDSYVAALGGAEAIRNLPIPVF
ncbi:CoA transferase subunit A [Oceanicola sp. S124]|uniref:CoA transferase subunit A n=1 Tax=Oceanicola sp. S124 TaxID=1042378 RepID=UPI0002557914|nr:CoA-transferase [Oceanicola sp. S124]